MTLALQGTPPTACSEHELVAAVRRGDDRAFEVLFSRYKQRITAYVAGMVGDHARAEDIRQDVFISALRRMRATQREIAFKPWIYEIAKNACIDEFRRARRNAEVAFEDGDGSALAAPTLFVHAPAPDAAIESKQRLDDLCGAFRGLSENHHRVLVLRELEGLSYSEIGERLGMTRAMVESTLFRARRRLSEEYEELASGRRCARVQSLIAAGDERPVTSLGVRERRQLARHLAHCDPCRHRARAGGVDESLLAPRRGIARIAGLLLPFPLLRWRRGASHDEAVAQSGSHSIAIAQSLQNVAQLADLTSPSTAFGRAAAAAAAIALAGAGAGIGTTLGSGRAHSVTRARAAASTIAASRTAAPRRSVANNVAAVATPPIVRAGGVRAPSGPPAQSESAGRGSVATSTPGPVNSTGTPDGLNALTPASSATGGTPAGAPSVATPAAPGASNGGVGSVSSVSAPAPSSAPTAPPVPSTSGVVPSEGSPQFPSNPTGTAQGAQGQTAPSPQSTVSSAQSTVTQTASQVTQSLPSPPAVSPPRVP
ncbi:MAG TPA: sigma-70 family RNA polymerase sigma factor [Solirubrobacteraceae bacterium]